MPCPASPSEVVRALMQGISSGEWERLHDWYAEDAVVEYPFALPAPTRLQGRQAIKDDFALAAKKPAAIAAARHGRARDGRS